MSRRFAGRRGARAVGLATLGLVIGAFAVLAGAVAITTGEPDAVGHKIDAASRHLYYRVTSSRGPVFELAGDETSLRLIAHARMHGAFDPVREVEFGIRIELSIAGTPWRRDVYTRARQSKARPRQHPGGDIQWLDENTFSLERDLQFSDDRQFVIGIPPGVAPGTPVKVTLIGDANEGIVRAYAPMTRAEASRRLATLPDVDRQRIASQVGYAPWDRLDATNQLAAVRFVDRRLPAEGKQGDDYEIREVFTTGFRIRESTADERGDAAGPTRDVAINVSGPTTVTLVVRRGVDSVGVAGTAHVESVSTMAPASPIDVPLPPHEPVVTRKVDVPDGVHTLVVSSSIPAAIEMSSARNEPLTSDEQRIATYLAGPDHAGVEIATEGPVDSLGRAVRVDVRLLVTSAPQRGQVLAGKVTFEALAADGSILATSTSDVETIVSRFEVAQLFGKQQTLVCEPVGVVFVAPNDASAIRVQTTVSALVSVSAPISGTTPPDRLAPPYDGFAVGPDAPSTWRYARLAERSWVPIRARNHGALYPHRIAALLVQARLEPRISPPAPTIAASSLVPSSRLERQTLIERVDPATAGTVLATWGPGHYTRVTPGREIRLDFSRPAGRAGIYYMPSGAHRAEDIVGATLDLELDGMPLDGQQLTSTRGTVALPRGLTGAHTLLVKTAAPVRLMVDRAPRGSGAELLAHRVVYRVPVDGAPVRLSVTKRTAQSQNVDVVLYTSSAGGAVDRQVRILVDRGAPARVTGAPIAKWTIADRVVPLPPSERAATLGFADLARGGAMTPHLIGVTLGDDLAPGTHEIELRLTEGWGAASAWGRFFTFDGGGGTSPRALQWRDHDALGSGATE